MSDSAQVRTYLVDFELNELVVNMCALVHYHSKKIKELAELSSARSDQQLKDKAMRYADITETLIMRMQDALDEVKLRSLTGKTTKNQPNGIEV